MENIMGRLSAPLTKADIELRVGSVSKKGVTLLLYKTARTDVKRLNEVCGLNWSNKHFYDNEGLLCCEISVFDGKQWVSRVDVGTESFTEKEKGSYSDSFKRAGFRWGIGIELYNTGFVFINWETEESDYNGKKQYKLKDFFSSNLDISEYFVVEGVPYFIITYKGDVVFNNTKGVKKPVSDAEQNESFKLVSCLIDLATPEAINLQGKNILSQIKRQRDRLQEGGEQLMELFNMKLEALGIDKYFYFDDRGSIKMLEGAEVISNYKAGLDG